MGQALLVAAEGLLGALAPNGPGHLRRNVLEHAQLGRAVGRRVAVVLDDHRADGHAVHDEGDAQPDGRGSADEPDLAAAAQLAVGGLVAEERPARPDDVFGQTLARLDGLRRGVLLVPEIGEFDELRGPVVEGDVEIPRRHDRADGGVDGLEEVVQPGRGVRGLGDLVDGALEEIGLLALVDVVHHADHPAQVPVVLDEEEAAVVEPAVAAVLVAEAVIDLVDLPVLLALVEEPEGLVPVLGVDPLRPLLDAAHLLGQITHDLFEVAAPGDLAVGHVVVVDDLAGSGDDELVFLPLVDVGRLVILGFRPGGRDRGGCGGGDGRRAGRPDLKAGCRETWQVGLGVAEEPHHFLGPIFGGGGVPVHPLRESFAG